MKKISNLAVMAAAAVALLVTNTVKAQTSEAGGDSKATRFGVGLSLGAPTTEGYNFAVGGDLRLQKDFSGNVSGILSAGYTNFSLENEDAGSFGFIPVKAGIKVFPKAKFYFSGELGAGIPTDSESKTAFLWAPGLGYGFNNGVDVGLRYEGFEVKGGSLGQVALRLAYGFRL
jgi:opacity protein-like surface antigen